MISVSVMYLLESIVIAFVIRELRNKKSFDITTMLITLIIMMVQLAYVRNRDQQGGGLQAALGMQRTLQKKEHIGGGIQAALGMQRTLQKKEHIGGGIQAALGMQRTLQKKELNEDEAFLPTSYDLLDEAVKPAQVNIIERFMDDKMALDYYKNDRMIEGMDDKVALDYYKNDRMTVEGMDDKVALAYYKNDRMTTVEGFNNKTSHDYYTNHRMMAGKMHEAFTDDIKQHVVSSIKPKEDDAYKPFVRIEPFVDSGSNQVIYDNYKPGLGPTAGEKGLVYGTLTPNPTGSNGLRTGQALYSQDLITIASAQGQQLMLLDNSKFVRGVDKKEDGLNNMLFKLRFKLVGKKGDNLQPIKYGDPVYMLYNDSQAQTTYINHDGNLNILINKRDIIFELINKDRPTSKEVVNTSDSILIRRSVEGIPKQYLHINQDSMKVETEVEQKEATVFMIKPQKGCGPLWRHDSDTRGTNLFNQSQVKDIVIARTQRLVDKISELQGSIGKSQETSTK
jgi:hypothetical protein